MPIWDKATFDTFYSLPGWATGIRDITRVPRFHYNWFANQENTQRIVDRYFSLPGWAQVSSAAVVGGGYGWTAEAIAAQGVSVVVVETSDHIINTIGVSEEQDLRDTMIADGWDPDNLPVFLGPDWNTPVDPWTFWLRGDGVRSSATVLDEDLSTNNSRRNVRSALSGNMDAILTEFAIDSMDAGDDAASLVLIERCEQLRPNPNCNVIHLIEPNPSDAVLNVKTAEAWRALLDANGYTDHYVVDINGTVLGPEG